MAQANQRKTDVTVGVFVAIGLVVTFLTMFVIGAERKLWEKSAHLKARFSNVGGLKVGAQVRLAGLSIGLVSKIELPELDATADEAFVARIPLDQVKTDDGLVDMNLPLKKQKLADPANVALLLNDDEGRTQVTVEITGTDFHGLAARERLLVHLHHGEEAVVVGKTYWAQIDAMRIVTLKDASPGSTLRVGDGTARKMTVDMRISADTLERVRTDSIAQVQTEGVLGDKYLDISIGSISKPAVKDGDLLPSDEGVDVAAALAQTGEIIDNVNAATESIRLLLEGFRKAGGEATVTAAVKSIQGIADEIRTGNGLIHQLVFDKKTGEQYKEIIGNIQASTKRVDESLGKVDGILADVRSNKSLVHELLYGQGGEAVVSDARGLITQVTQVVDDIRTKEGLVHNLIYAPDKGEIIANINAATADAKAITGDVKSIVAEVKRGKGTVGQLLNDPSVYEDMKVLLGNVRRNDAVKTLVRYAIEQEDKKATTQPKPAK